MPSAWIPDERSTGSPDGPGLPHDMIRHLTVVPETADTAAAEPGLGTSIAALRREQQLPQQACCDALGCFGIPLSSAALSRWENGSNTPGCYELLALSHALGQEGRLERFAQDSDDASPSDLPEVTGRAFSDFLLRQELKESARRRPHMVLFPVAENYASAGTGQPLDDDLFTMVSLPASEIPPRAAFAVRIAGDSMEPRYHDGQLVFIEKTSHLTDGEIGVFSLDGEGYIKQYREQPLSQDLSGDDFFDEDTMRCQVSLVSVNPVYKPIRVLSGSAFMIFGRVL